MRALFSARPRKKITASDAGLQLGRHLRRRRDGGADRARSVVDSRTIGDWSCGGCMPIVAASEI